MGRILVIDDEAPVRRLLHEALAGAGHQVFQAAEGGEGLRIFRGGRIDLVILDLLMPGQEGLGTLQAMHRLDPAVRVIAISGGMRFQTVDVLDMARRLGACRTFHKPLDLEGLVDAVRAELEMHPAA